MEHASGTVAFSQAMAPQATNDSGGLSETSTLQKLPLPFGSKAGSGSSPFWRQWNNRETPYQTIERDCPRSKPQAKLVGARGRFSSRLAMPEGGTKWWCNQISGTVAFSRPWLMTGSRGGEAHPKSSLSADLTASSALSSNRQSPGHGLSCILRLRPGELSYMPKDTKSRRDISRS